MDYLSREEVLVEYGVGPLVVYVVPKRRIRPPSFVVEITAVDLIRIHRLISIPVRMG